MPKKEKGLTLLERDYRSLSALVASCHRATADKLEEELGKANVVEDRAAPEGLVSMNCIVRVEDIGTGATLELKVVYPHEANADEGKVSVLAPMGMALIGLSQGQRYSWPMPGGRRKDFRVAAVQPAAEAATEPVGEIA